MAYTLIKKLTNTLEVEFEMQKRYNAKSKHTADFYIPKYKVWIEIGNINTKKYLDTISKKQKWVEKKGEIFIRCQHPSSLIKQLTGIINE